MTAAFDLAAFIAVVSTVLAISRSNAVHGLLYLIVSLLAIAVIFFTLGAPFAAALEVIVYAGAIMVLFLFAIMMLTFNQESHAREKIWIARSAWTGPVVLSLLLIALLSYALSNIGSASSPRNIISVQAVGLRLFGPYVVAVELASMLLLGALVATYHLGRTVSPAK